MSRDDVITAINDKPVNSIADILSIYDTLDNADSGQTEVMFEFARRGRNQLTLLDMQNRKGVSFWWGILNVLTQLTLNLSTF